MTASIHSSPPVGVDDLLTRTGSGDERAFAALYDHGAATIHGLVLRALRDPAVSNAVTRAVWVRVWRSAGRYTPDQGSAIAWVISLAHRTIVERIRSAPRDTTPTRIGSSRTGHVSSEPGSVSYLSMAARRRAVLLAYYQGRTTEQISTTLGVPHDTVATMVHSGLLHLRAHLRMADNTAVDVDSLNTAVDAEQW
ncbi:sigma factor [Nocardiopsis quinghaiensis]|uniref:sigma factor n=1 Tax=Nocardiopsis quinghaiensis TaxID=464995 RepID=UPI00123A009F|nr:sigma factor [Nocardiopsis quinghaiensis]